TALPHGRAAEGRRQHRRDARRCVDDHRRRRSGARERRHRRRPRRHDRRAAGARRARRRGRMRRRLAARPDGDALRTRARPRRRARCRRTAGTAARHPGRTGPNGLETSMTRKADLDTARRDAARLARTAGDVAIERLLQGEPDRARRLCVDAAQLHLDLTRQRLPGDALAALIRLAESAGVEARRDAMYAGEAVNFTEGRPALHVALRAPAPAARPGAASDAARDRIAEVAATLERMAQFSDAVRSGAWRGATGRPISDIVHVGIGGSHLGPQLACEALAGYAHPRLQCRFLSNVDPQAFDRAVAGCDPATTLAIVASKSWHTQETARNALALRRWFEAGGIDQQGLQRHLVGVTANVDAAIAFGLAEASIFPFRDWVGGRYSLWSAI